MRVKGNANLKLIDKHTNVKWAGPPKPGIDKGGRNLIQVFF